MAIPTASAVSSKAISTLVNCSRASIGDACERFSHVAVAEITAPADVLVARIVARGRETPDEARERVLRKVPDYPAGVRVERIVNDGLLADSVDRFCALLRSLRPDAQGQDVTISDEDRAEVWPRLVAVWPLYDAYEDRAGRGLRVFHLTPVPTR